MGTGDATRMEMSAQVNKDSSTIASAPGGNGGNSILLNEVTHYFDDEPVPVIDHVSAVIGSRQFISVIGPSGCGKTTLLNIIAGLIPLQRGQVLLSGEPPRAGRPDVGYMLARDALLPWLTVKSNAAFGLTIRGERAKEANDRVLGLLRQVGLADFANRYPRDLSQGMRQRVALVRTFCLQTPMLLMDEPFGALDAQTKLQLEDLLLQLWETERKTVVFVTHDLTEAIALSDRVIVLGRRPAKIVDVIPIDLPRPRSVRELQEVRRYHELYSQVWRTLEKGAA